MKLKCRSLLHALTCVMALGAAADALAQAANYPSKPIKIIVPFAPGGPNDFLGRVVGQKLGDLWGHPAIIENRGGAGEIGRAHV